MNRRKTLALIALSIGLISYANAQERGTKDEAKAMAEAAFAHIKAVGPDKAFKDFTHDKGAWTKKDLYVFVFDNKGVLLAHGGNEKLVGKDLSGIRDANGKPTFPVMLEIASKGSGWMDYDFTHPQTKKVEGKTSFVIKLPSGEGLLAVGAYR